jgi:hypothetical protein
MVAGNVFVPDLGTELQIAINGPADGILLRLAKS